jgi:hypothetical protein
MRSEPSCRRRRSTPLNAAPPPPPKTAKTKTKKQDFIQRGRLSPEQVSGLAARTPSLLADPNPRHALMALQAWELVARTSRDAARPHALALAPSMAERLGDSRQDTRQLACNCLVEFTLAHTKLDGPQPQPPARGRVLEGLAHCWRHRAWKVRHGALQLLAESLALTGDAALLEARAPETPEEVERAAKGAAAALAAAADNAVACCSSIFDTPAYAAIGGPSASPGSSTALSQALRLLEDPEPAVRDAALECLEEAAPVVGAPALLAAARANLHCARPCCARCTRAWLLRHPGRRHHRARALQPRQRCRRRRPQARAFLRGPGLAPTRPGARRPPCA